MWVICSNQDMLLRQAKLLLISDEIEMILFSLVNQQKSQNILTI